MKKSARILCVSLIVLGALNFGAFIIHSQQLGGDAGNGRQANGRFYVRDKSVETEVSERQWQLSKWHALSLILTHPLAMGAMFTLIFRQEFPKKMFRGTAEERAQTVEQIRASGPLINESGSSGKIGSLNVSVGLMKVTVYPGGFACWLRFIGEFGITAEEIESAEKQSALLNSGILIVHNSPNIVSPILLRCEGSESLKGALLSLSKRDIH